MQFRIGERDPGTGLYYVIHPDGSRLLNGIKIFNSAYTEGDPVLATERSDGMMILDGVNALEDVSNNPDTQVSEFGKKPTSYLKGQVFNNEEEELPRVTIALAPNSPPAAKPQSSPVGTPRLVPSGTTVYYPRFTGSTQIDLIVRFTLDRPFQKELLVDISLEDDDVSDPLTAISISDFKSYDYMRVYLSSKDGEPIKYSAKIKIPANKKFIDVGLTLDNSSSFYNKTSYTAKLKSTFAAPRARSIKADVPIIVKNDRALIYKVVESKISINSGSFGYPQLFTSDIDIASIPYFGGIGASANTSELTFLDFTGFPPTSPPYRQVVSLGIDSSNPDTAPDAWSAVRYLEFILPNLLPRTTPINKRYIYVVESRMAFHNEPPVSYDDFRDRSWRHTVSAEISGSTFYNETPDNSILFIQQNISSDLVSPYFRPRSQHLGYIESTWLSRSVTGDVTGLANSQTFYQSCLKIDTQNPSQSKFIPCPASTGNVVNPNPQTFYLP